MQIVLDGEKMLNMEITHKYIKSQLNFPDYYGMNLDALWDMLYEMDGDISIKIINSSRICKNLNEYGRLLLNVFIDMEEERSDFKLEII